MEFALTLFLVIGAVTFAAGRLMGRRGAEPGDLAQRASDMGMMTWLPAWMLFRWSAHDGDRRDETGSPGYGSDTGWGGSGGESSSGPLDGGGGDSAN